MGEGATTVAQGRGRNYVVVSADTHASPDSLEHFLSYVDPAQREAVAAFGDMSNLAISMFGGFDPGEVDESDPVRATAARRLAGMGVDIAAAEGWLAHYGTDWVVPGDGDGRRLAVLEEQGIHAEVALPGPILAGGLSPAMYLGAATDKGLEVVWPALHGYLRWLADFCAAAPGRRAGVMPIDFHDMDRAVEEVGWARDNGIFGGVMLPAMSVTSRLPGYADDYYEPFWSVCEEHGMVVNLHTGASGSATDTKFLYDAEHGGMLGLYEVFVFTRRPLWFMIFGGVFDRHPDLRVVVSENGVQWLPSLIRDMESFFDTHGGAPVRSYLQMRPRDYFEKHVWMGGSLMKRYEAEMRHEIGIDKLMWGADYPHLEGAAPVHRETLRYIFGGLPEDDLRRILGANAVDLWGFDAALLQSVADRVGPTVADLASPLALADIEDTFSWSLARPVPLVAERADSSHPAVAARCRLPGGGAGVRFALKPFFFVDAHAPPSGDAHAPPSGDAHAPPSGDAHAPPSGTRTHLLPGTRMHLSSEGTVAALGRKGSGNTVELWGNLAVSVAPRRVTTPCLHRSHGVGELRRSTRGTDRLGCGQLRRLRVDGAAPPPRRPLRVLHDRGDGRLRGGGGVGGRWGQDGGGVDRHALSGPTGGGQAPGAPGTLAAPPARGGAGLARGRHRPRCGPGHRLGAAAPHRGLHGP